MNSQIPVVIPAYQPSKNLVRLTQGLLAAGISRIVVVNDGSSPHYSPIFDRVKRFGRVSYLQHKTNLGKGAALKTGFRFIAQKYLGVAGVVTADADGQHTVEDIVKIAEWLQNHPAQLVLGVRNFTGRLPWRSWLGNVLTRKIFFWQTGQQISDTQTGLRGIPQKYLSEIVKLPGEGYEYEMNVLLWAVRTGVTIHEEKISTIYTPGNSSSHFHPILDSMRIYWILLRYIFSSLITAGMDILLFCWLIQLGNSIMVSILISRWVVGAGVNFTLNRSLVFRSGSVIWPVLFRYYLVISVLGLVASWLIGQLIQLTGLPVIYSKIIIEVALFPVGFIIQKRWVFTSVVSEVE